MVVGNQEVIHGSNTCDAPPGKYACVCVPFYMALTALCSSAVPSTTVVTCRWHKESNSNSLKLM